ncbi:MAG: fibronectin type III domain-containing protein, partial [Bacteroidales bacterium]|nr:fibronectin type III domain-containing protein [Bacteroidales bacterium]
MKYKNILKSAVLVIASLALAACAENEFEEITDINLSRCLEPQNLSAKVDPATGDVVTFSWDVNKDADSYNLVVYSDEAMTKEELNVTIPSTEVPYTVRLTADKKYYFKVQALSEKRSSSVWAVFDGSASTRAVKDNLFLEVTDRSATSISLSWSSDVSDYLEVTHITAVPVKGGEEKEFSLSAADAQAAAAVLEGLEPSTEYQLTLYYLSASRGSVDTWTRAEQGSSIAVSNSADLVSLMTEGNDIYLTLAGSPYEISNVKPKGTVRLYGEIG